MSVTGGNQTEVFLMENNNYVTIYEEYKHKFIQLPKVFFTNPKYENMRNDSKLAWALLRDRSSLSKKNKWFDKDTGRVYFVYTNAELMKVLKIGSNTTLQLIKKELIKAGLIQTEKQGVSRADKMYLLYPIVEDEDIEKIDAMENPPVSENNAENVGTSRRTDSVRPENVQRDVQNLYTSNTELSDTESLKDLDTKDTKDTKNDLSENVNMSEIEKLRKRKELTEKAYRENTTKIPLEISETLNVFCNSEEQRNEYYKVMITAKRNAEKDLNTLLTFEQYSTLASDISQAFIRAIRNIEKSKSVGNPSGYIFKSVYQTLIDNYSVFRDVPEDGKFYNWLEDRS